MSSSLVPEAIYKAPDMDIDINFHPGEGPHSTSGKTTQISDIVIKAGGEDRDKPSEPNNTPLGHLRARLTTLQDDINIFLTKRMKDAKIQQDEADLERRVLDDGVDEDDED